MLPSPMRICCMLMWAAKNKLAVPNSLKAFGERMRTHPTVHIALKHQGLG